MKDAANCDLPDVAPGCPAPSGTPGIAPGPGAAPARKPRKLRSDSTWSRLTPDQTRLLETWLFAERAGYREILARVEQHFGIRASRTSLCHYYQSRLPDRQQDELLLARLQAGGLNDQPVNLGSLRQSVVKLTAQAALNLPSGNPDHLDHLLSVGKLLLASERKDLQLALADQASGQIQEAIPGAPRLTGDEKNAQLQNILSFARQNPANPRQSSPSAGFNSV